MTSPPAVTPTQLRALVHCAAVLLPSDPPPEGRVAFWRHDGGLPEEEAPADQEGGGDGPAEELLTVALPDADGGVALCEVPAQVLPVADAVPVLTRARTARATPPAAAFWGTASLLALHAARGRILPGLSPAGYDTWRLGPRDPADLARLGDLAAAMPPSSHAVPLPGTAPVALPDPERQLRAFLDAVADGLPRSPAAALITGAPAFAGPAPQHLPEQRAWAADVAAGQDAGVRISLRVAAHDAGSGAGSPISFTAVLQLHSRTDPALRADAAEVWAGATPAGQAFGPRAARHPADLAPCGPGLGAAHPVVVRGRAGCAGPRRRGGRRTARAGRALAAAGVQVHWPENLVGTLTTRAVVGSADAQDGTGAAGSAGLPSLLSARALLSFSWRFAVGGREVERAELERLAEAGRPLVRLHDRWVLVDPEAVRAARDREIAPLDALGAALTGSAEDSNGDRVEVTAAGPLARLRDLLSAQEGGDAEPVRQPAALRATLRDYQGAAPVFLLSLKAAATGLNLTRASHVVHFDRWWNPAVEAQATDRAYRIGQTRPVQVHRIVTEGTIEDRIADMLCRKQQLADAVLGSGEAALTELTDAELADLVALRGNER